MMGTALLMGVPVRAAPVTARGIATVAAGHASRPDKQAHLQMRRSHPMIVKGAGARCQQLSLPALRR